MAEKKRCLKSTAGLAEAFSLDRRNVNRLIVQAGLEVRGERGCRLYDVEEAVRAFVTEGGERAMSVNGQIKMLKRKQVAAMLGVCTKTMDRYLKSDPDFPQPCLIGTGGGTFRWIEAEVEQYVESRRHSYFETVA